MKIISDISKDLILKIMFDKPQSSRVLMLLSTYDEKMRMCSFTYLLWRM